MKKPQKKDFDCIRMKREAQARIYGEINSLTPEQEIAYFHNATQSGALAHWWKKVKSPTVVSVPDRHSVEQTSHIND